MDYNSMVESDYGKHNNLSLCNIQFGEIYKVLSEVDRWVLFPELEKILKEKDRVKKVINVSQLYFMYICLSFLVDVSTESIYRRFNKQNEDLLSDFQWKLDNYNAVSGANIQINKEIYNIFKLYEYDFNKALPKVLDI